MLKDIKTSEKAFTEKHCMQETQRGIRGKKETLVIITCIKL